MEICKPRQNKDIFAFIYAKYIHSDANHTRWKSLFFFLFRDACQGES